MISSVTVRARHGNVLTLAGGSSSVTIDGRPEASGALLGLAIAGCYANTLLAEATRRGVQVSQLEVDVETEWDVTPPCTRSVTVHVSIAADTDQETVMDLVEHADRVSVVANAVRLGVPVRVADLHVTASPP